MGAANAPARRLVAIRSALRNAGQTVPLARDQPVLTIPSGPNPVSRRFPGRNWSDALKVRHTHSRS